MAAGRSRTVAAAVAAGTATLLAGTAGLAAVALTAALDGGMVRTVLGPPTSGSPTRAQIPLDGAHPAAEPLPLRMSLAVAGPAGAERGSRGAAVRVSGAALPARVLLSYRNAEDALRRSDPSCHLPWNLLAGIGQVESGQAYGGAVDPQGRTLSPILGPVLDGSPGVAAIPDTDGGRLDGDTTWDRAVGPMQFIPTSWAVWGRDGDGNGTADPSDVDDASLSAGTYLCAGGGDLRREQDRRDAVFSYNHSLAYVDLVLAWADAFATGDPQVTSALVAATGGTGRPTGSAPATAPGTDAGVAALPALPSDVLVLPPGGEAAPGPAPVEGLDPGTSLPSPGEPASTSAPAASVPATSASGTSAPPTSASATSAPPTSASATSAPPTSASPTPSPTASCPTPSPTGSPTGSATESPTSSPTATGSAAPGTAQAPALSDTASPTDQSAPTPSPDPSGTPTGCPSP